MQGIENVSAEEPRSLSAKYISDFAYPTVKDRMPVILTKVIDTIYRMKSDTKKDLGDEGLDDLKNIAGELSRLKNYMQTNKPLTDIAKDGVGDEDLWNRFLHADRKLQRLDGCESAWFVSPWLLTECYFYRCIISAIRLSNRLQSLDPYTDQKRETFFQSQAAMLPILSHLLEVTKNGEDGKSLTVFTEYFHVSLWGNKCDLSISGGEANSQLDVDPIGQALRLRPNILCDDTEAVWYHLMNNRKTGRIDIVLDNAGFELVTDLCLAELLISFGMASTVRFHAKSIPWFISDVTPGDWHWTFDQLLSENASSHVFKAFGERCRQRVANGSWQFNTHPFWTLPHDFALMKSTCEDLHSSFAGSDLVLFKGDLNYRKLVGDLLWPPTTPFSKALRGFSPAPLCSLRTLKCDVVTGLEPGKAEAAAKQAADWMFTGSFSVIQFVV